MEGLEKDKELAEFIKKLKISKYGKSRISLDKVKFEDNKKGKDNTENGMNESKMSESKYDPGASTMSKKSTASVIEPKHIFLFFFFSSFIYIFFFFNFLFNEFI